MVEISILIPTYNRKEYIKECILSAINQDYTNFEIIIVDNQSDDGTWEICKELSKIDCRIKIFQNKTNIGPVLNWLRCAKEASGEYSKILFSDDILDKSCLSKLKSVISSNKIAFSFCAAQIGTSIQESKIFYANDPYTKFNKNKYTKLLLAGKAPISPGAILLRTKDLIKNISFDIESTIKRPYKQHGAGPDLLISLNTLMDYKYVVSFNKPLVFFRSHNKSLTIEDKNFEVSDGYASTWCYFMRKNMTILHWAYCIALFYKDNRSNRGIKIKISDFCKIYNGNGNILEVLLVYLFLKLKIK